MTTGKAMRRAAVGWVAALGSLLVVSGSQAEPWKHLLEADGLPNREIQFIKRAGEDLWVGTSGGLVLFRGGNPTPFHVGEAVWDLLPAKADVYWIGTENGVVLKVGATETRSLEGHAIGRILPFSSTVFWAIARQKDRAELMEFRAKVWRPVPRFEGMKIRDLFQSRDGRLWVLLDANGIVAVNPADPPEKWVHHQEGLNITAFHEDTKGRIRCGTWGRGVWSLDQGTWTRMLEKEDAVITAVRTDGKGHLWVATNAHGLWEYDGAAWVKHLKEEGTINFLETTSDGRVFISSQSVCSLRAWNGKSWEVAVDTPTMFNCLADGPDRKVWAGNILNGLYVEP